MILKNSSPQAVDFMTTVQKFKKFAYKNSKN